MTNIGVTAIIVYKATEFDNFDEQSMFDFSCSFYLVSWADIDAIAEVVD